MSENRADIIEKVFDPVLPLDDLIVCPLLDRVVVIVRETEFGLAKVLAPTAAAKANCEVVVLTPERLDNCIDRAMTRLETMRALSRENVEDLVSQGVLTLRDLREIGSIQLTELLGIPSEQADAIIHEAAQRMLQNDDDAE